MVKEDLADGENDIQYSGTSKVSFAYGREDQGSKKTEYTDAIFENVWKVNSEADGNAEMLRISVDTKATVPVGEYSRNGQSRGLEPIAALDHDMHPKEKLTPGGILEAISGQAFLFFTDSSKTSDFIVDGLHAWWQARRGKYTMVKQLIINMDNGPECSGRRSQFLYRITDFADTTGLSVRLIYYPPYHSKYNAIERYWAGLEKSWNGYLLNTVRSVLHRAGNFCWKGKRSIIRLFDASYEKGVIVSGKARVELEARLQRDPDLPLWDITINPIAVY